MPGHTDKTATMRLAAEDGPERFGMTGPERAMRYQVAVETELRVSGLRSLVRASFDLEANPPTVTIAAGYSKRRREDTLPLRRRLADDLRDFPSGKTPTAQVFAVPPSYDTADMLRADLAAAGIPYRDEAGRLAGFHILRHTFISNLAAGGVHPKTAQTLARHSTVTLTMDRYTHSVLGDLSDALGVLTDLAPTKPEEQRQRATGTDGRSLPLYLPSGATSKGTPAAPVCTRDAVPRACHNEQNPMEIGDSRTDLHQSARHCTKPPEEFEPMTYGLQNRCPIP
ncbi:unnamed protein product [marine sediment metagenome]|uniref:Tyr recombinase domain-containing protein n=1 Tax=marine sediment metagenome TaxID=412755 RepID=X0SNN7_9ZZZZ